MPKFSHNVVVLSMVFISTLLIDKFTKIWIIGRLHYGEMWVLIPDRFNLTHVRNPGGAFSFMVSMPSGLRFAFFLSTGVLAVVLLLSFFRRLEPGRTLSAAAIGAVLGGAIGNLSDRVVYGEVIDFLDVRLWGGYIWPTFNMADCWIVVGVGLLMLEMFLEPDIEEVDAEDGIKAPLAKDAPGPSAS
ncbi:MAG TPA: signal peptidase II [Myxococcales bacterium]|nr:signal peptidase II [Myxococcales bacterium]HIK85571.1 signal peptidase II [Myxococcales bacterium]